jgi:phage major head subunit gpT-like protein
MQRKQYPLVERIYGSVSAARAAWAEQALRERAREAARTYSRTGQVPQDRLFVGDRTSRPNRRS